MLYINSFLRILMKKLFTLLLMFAALSAFAKDDRCSMVIPWTTGGTSDLAARALQKGNNNILIDYKPGAFAAVAVNHINSNPDVFMLSPLHMFSAGNPIKDVNLDVTRVMYGTDFVIVTGKDVKVEDLLTKKINLGIPGLGTGYHAIALDIQQRNNQLEIIPMGSDAKAIPSLINKDIDAYIASGPIAKQWTESFPTISNVLDLPFGKKVTVSGLTLQNFTFQGILVNKNASQEQKSKVDQCIDAAVSSSEFKKEADRLSLRVINSSGTEATRVTNEYFRMMKKHGL